MTRGEFHLVRLDEAGPCGPDDKRRLVCVTDSGGKLAIWGQEVPVRNMRNIDAVLKAGMPCSVECDYSEPGDWAARFGHTHWVEQHSALRVL